jgi:hypothetical protein
MRRAAIDHSLPIVALLLLPFTVAAEETTTTTVPALNPPPIQETTVRGTPPEDLAGRWLALASIELPEGKGNAMPAFWEIATQDGKLTLTHRYVDLPLAQKTAIEAAGADGQAWSPTPEDLAAIKAAWGDLKPVESHVRQVTTEIAGKDGFDDNLTKEERTRDAIWVIRERMDVFPSAAPVVRYAFVYAATAAKDGDYTGNFDGVTVAAAPFPIPITVKGSVHFYRLSRPAPTPPAGILARLLDQLRGCGAGGRH